MTVQVFRSTDPGAPVYTNTAGSLIAILDFVLLNLAVPWTKTVLAANQAAYTQPAGTNGFTLQVDDTGTTQARLTAWETLSAFNTGFNEFPSAYQMINVIGISDGLGGYVMKPSGVSNPAWRVFTNGKIFYFYVVWTTSPDYYTGIVFGDFISYKAGDAFNTVFSCQSTASAPYKPFASLASAINAPLGGGCFAASPRRYTQIGGSNIMGGISDSTRGNTPTSGEQNATYNPFPSVIDGSFQLAPMWITEPITSGSNGVRGLMPGIWFIIHPPVFNDGYTFTASSGNIAGRSFEIVGAPASSYGVIAMETSNTWGGF